MKELNAELVDRHPTNGGEMYSEELPLTLPSIVLGNAL
jgi:hypothetical protein